MSLLKTNIRCSDRMRINENAMENARAGSRTFLFDMDPHKEVMPARGPEVFKPDKETRKKSIGGEAMVPRLGGGIKGQQKRSSAPESGFDPRSSLQLAGSMMSKDELGQGQGTLNRQMSLPEISAKRISASSSSGGRPSSPKDRESDGLGSENSLSAARAYTPGHQVHANGLMDTPPTGNAMLDSVLAKLNKPKLREALDRLAKEATHGKGKNSVIGLFQEFDTNGDGVLSRDEVSAGLRKLELALMPIELDALMRAFDLDGNGTIDIHEFSEVMMAYKACLGNWTEPEKTADPHDPFPVGAKVRALFKLPNMSSQEGTVVARRGGSAASYEVLFVGAERPSIVKATQIKCR